MTFSSLGLRKPILDGVKRAGYTEPTDIQKDSIPLVLAGHDLVSCGETGSGKTAAFGLPILNKMLDEEPGLKALILVPTRELCVQVAENLRIYASRTDIAVCTAFGGIDMGIQEAAIRRGCDVMVACPGRMIDHLERGNVSLDKLEYLVLDEADRMLDMGFMPQITRILMRCQGERQTLLFSATMPPDVARLVKEFIPEHKSVQVGRRSQAPRQIEHRFEEMRGNEKTRRLTSLLRDHKGQVLIFVKTKLSAQKLGNELKRTGLGADSIHGDKSAEARHSILQAFDRGKIRCLVATDVAARGIDVDTVTMVVNYDMPRAVEDYVHRVGRTGRAGRKGLAISFWTSMDRGVYAAVQKSLKAKTDQEAGEASEDADVATAQRFGGGRGAGGRGAGGRGAGGRGAGGRGAEGRGGRESRGRDGGSDRKPRGEVEVDVEVEVDADRSSEERPARRRRGAAAVEAAPSEPKGRSAGRGPDREEEATDRPPTRSPRGRGREDREERTEKPATRSPRGRGREDREEQAEKPVTRSARGSSRDDRPARAERPTADRPRSRDRNDGRERDAQPSSRSSEGRDRNRGEERSAGRSPRGRSRDDREERGTTRGSRGSDRKDRAATSPKPGAGKAADDFGAAIDIDTTERSERPRRGRGPRNAAPSRG